jgi:hypothetical protein
MLNLLVLVRAAMAAAMVGETIGKMIRKEMIPTDITQYGQSISEIFNGFPELRARFGDEVDHIPLGAIGVFNYIERINTGYQQLMALCRKYKLDCIIVMIYSTNKESARITGLAKIMDIDLEEIDNIIVK